MFNRNPHKDRLSDGSNGQIKQGLAKQHNRKFKLYKSLVTSILLYGCESLTLLAYFEKKIQAFVTQCLRKRVHMFYIEHETSDSGQEH